MSYRQAPAGLPVSATVPNDAMFIQGLPQNVPFAPPVNASPQMQQLVPVATGFFLMELQNNAPKNASRTFLFNVLSQNGYQNNEFLEALQSVVDYAEFLIATQNMPAEQAVPQAAAELASIMACIQVRKFPQLEQMLPQGGMQSVEQWLNHFNKIANALEQYKRQAQQQPQWPRQQQGGFPGNQAQFGQQWGPQQMPQQQWGPQQAPQAQWGPPNQQRFGGGSQQSPWGQPQQQQSMSGWRPGHQSGLAGARGGNQNANFGGQDMFQTGPTNAPQNQGGGRQLSGSLTSNRNRAVVDDMDKYGPTPTQEPASVGFPGQDQNWTQQHAAEPFEAPAEPTPPAPTNERPFDYINTGDEELMPAHLTNWTKDFTFEQPYRIAFDPSEEIKFLRRDRDGVVQERMEKYGEHMDYLKHEMNPTFDQKTRLEEHEARIVPNWDMVSDMKTLPTLDENGVEVVEEGAPDIDPGKDPLVLPDILFSHSHDQAKFQHEICLMERGVAQKAEDLPYEYYYHHITPYLNLGDKGKNLQEILLIIKQVDSLSQFVEQLGELHGHVPSDAWHLIHDRATAKINEALSTNIQLDEWQIDSLVDDWDELRDAMVGEFGEEKGNGLFATLEVRAFEDVMAASINVLAGETLEEYLATLPEALTEKHPEFKERLVALSEACSVTHVPWNAADISVVIDDEGGAVLESRLPGLYKAIKGIVKRTQRAGLKFRHRYIVTNDNVKLEIHNGYMGKDFYLLKKA